MPKTPSVANVELDVDAGREIGLDSLTDDFAETQPIRLHRVLDEEDPFRILILGDFTGRASRGISEPSKIGARRTVLVDRDNVEQLPGKMGVNIRLSSSNPEAAPIEIPIKELDDFHPDRLYRNVRVF